MSVLPIRKLGSVAFLLSVFLSGCGAQVTTTYGSGSTAKTQTTAVGEMLSSRSNSGTGTLVSGGGVLPDAVYLKQADGVSFLREYYLRSDEPLPNIDDFSSGALGRGSSPLHDLAGKYGWERDGFKKRELAAAFDAEAIRVWKTGEKTRFLAIWQNAFFQAYDFESRLHTFCLSTGITSCLQSGKPLQLGYAAYALSVDAPASIVISPDEAVARHLEKAVSMQQPRGMRVLMIVELQDSASGRQLKGLLRGIQIYRREDFTDTMDVPVAARHLITVALKNEPAAVPSGPVALPVVKGTEPRAAVEEMARGMTVQKKFVKFPAGLKWKVMHYASFNFAPEEGKIDPQIKAGSYALWKTDLDAMKVEATQKKKEPAPAMVLTSAPYSDKYVFSMIDSAASHCIRPGNGAGMYDIYSICSMRIFQIDSIPISVRDIPDICFLHSDNSDHPVAKNHTEFAFQEADQVAYFRIIQYGKEVADCNRVVQFKSAR